MKKTLKIWFYITFVPSFICILVFGMQLIVGDKQFSTINIIMYSFIISFMMTQLLIFLLLIVSNAKYWMTVEQLEKRNRKLNEKINEYIKGKNVYLLSATEVYKFIKNKN